MLGRLHRIPILLWTGDDVVMLRVGIGAGTFSEEYLFVSNGLLIALAGVHGAAQLLLLPCLLVEVRVVHGLTCQPLPLLVCLTVELRGHGL